MAKQLTAFLLWLLLLHTAPLHAQQLLQRLLDKKQATPGTVTTDKDAPDYSNLFYWAAHPDIHDYSDSIPAPFRQEARDNRVDVFFLHPTTFLEGPAWNADVDDTTLNRLTDIGTMLYQASVFNGSCRIFAPRYRQANLKAFFMPNRAVSVAAFDLAYEDLAKAFRYYLEHWNNGRPVIIASHSQGSKHAIRLLQEFFDGQPLQQQLVCAYVIGWQVKKDDLKTIPPGNTPTATGCIVGWRCFRKGEATRLIQRENGNSICVNPITWTTDTSWVSKNRHKGAIGKDFNTIWPHCISAGIAPEANVLWVTLPALLAERMGEMSNYHVLDFKLFYADMRENVKQRIAAYYRNR